MRALNGLLRILNRLLKRNKSLQKTTRRAGERGINKTLAIGIPCKEREGISIRHNHALEIVVFKIQV